MSMIELCAIIFAYLIGAIPTGYLIARWYGVDDIRNHGSGNIGATNVARILGKKFFALILLLDFAKAYLVLRLLPCFGVYNLVLPAVALLVGNAYSVFLYFTGGKGAATSLGILAVVNPMLIVYMACVWLVVLALTRTVGIATVAALLALPMFAFYSAYELIGLTLFIAAFGIWLHRSNIRNYIGR